MSIDKKGFRYRLSNVIAWLGFFGGFGLGVALCSLIYFLATGVNNDGQLLASTFWSLFSAVFYLLVGVINYLMVGEMRLLPWKGIE